MNIQNIKNGVLEAVFKIDKERAGTVCAVVLVLLVLLPANILRGEWKQAYDETFDMRLQLEELTAENRELKMINEELQSQVEIMSNALNQQVQSKEEREEEEAKLCIPSEFPVTGAVSVIEVTKQMIEDKKAETAAAEDITQVEPLASDTPILIFQASAGNSVIVSGNGVVEAVEEDAVYGKAIVIDHGNGYKSIYRNNGIAKVEVGTNVTRGSVLFVISADNTMIGFQIKQDEEYLDPIEVVEIAG